MKNYAEHFDKTAFISRLDNDKDLSVEFFASVGDPDGKFSFLNSGKFRHKYFTTFHDAQNANELVRSVLELVDEHEEQQRLSATVIRDEVLDAVCKQFAIDGDPDDPDLINLKPAVERAIKEVFSYYEHFE